MDDPVLAAAAAAGDLAATRHLVALAAARRDDDAALGWAARLSSNYGRERVIVACLEEFGPRSYGLGTPWLPHVVRWLRRAASDGQSWATDRLGCDQWLGVASTRWEEQFRSGNRFLSSGVTEGPCEVLSSSEQADWRERAAASGSRRAAFLIAVRASDAPLVAEKWFRRVWLGVEDAGRAVERGPDDVSGHELLAAAHQIALLTVQHGGDEPRGWFERCTEAGDWYESETHANRGRALLDYYRWVAGRGEEETARRLLTFLVEDALEQSRRTGAALDDDAHKSYRDGWQAMSLDMFVWHEACIERADLALRSHDVAESSRMIRLASEMTRFSAREYPVVRETLSKLGPSGTPFALLTSTLEGALPAEVAAPIAAHPAWSSAVDPTAEESRVSYWLLDWLVREYLPAWLDLARAYDLAARLRERLPTITNATTAGAAMESLRDAFRGWDGEQSDVQPPSREPRVLGVFNRIAAGRRMDAIGAAAVRSVMRGVGGDVAPDLAEEGEVPEANRAASRRFLSSTNLWLAMWAATVNDGVVEAGENDETTPAHPWRELWDFASRKSWEVAQIASSTMVFEFCTHPETHDEVFDPVAILEMAFSPTTSALQASVRDACIRIALAAPEGD